jgi:predicted DNA-binding transcriptional regulator YafY
MAAILTALRGIRATLPSGEIDQAIEKVGSLIPRDKKDTVALYEEQVVLDMGGWYADGKRLEVLRRLHKAVAAQRLARFTYRNLRGIQSERTVEPMTLLCKGSAWYLFGYCRAKRDYRLFHTGRMGMPEIKLMTFTRRRVSYRDFLARAEEYFPADTLVQKDGYLIARTRIAVIQT